MAKTYVLVKLYNGFTVTLSVEAGTLCPGMQITDTVYSSDIIYGHFEPVGRHQQFVTLTGRMAVKVTVRRSDAPPGTMLMFRGFPVVAGVDHKLDNFFVMGTEEGAFKVCSGGVDMNQWGVHSVQANKDHDGYKLKGADAGTFQMDFYLCKNTPVEPTPVMRGGGTTRGGGPTRGGGATRGGDAPTRSYAAQFHNAGNSGQKTTTVEMTRVGPTATCSWRNRVADKVRLETCPMQFCSTVPAPIQADPEDSEDDDLD